MKRFLTLAGLIVAILVTFLVLVRLKMRADEPDVILAQLRRGKGDREQLMMKLNLARGDTVPGLIAAAQDETTDVRFRADMLELLFRRLRRSGDERITPVVLEALKSPEVAIRKTAAMGFDVYGDQEQRVHLIDCLDDPEPEVRRRALLFLNAGPRGWIGRSHDELWHKLEGERRSNLIDKCVDMMRTEADADLRYLARAVVGREMEFLCNRAHETISTAEFEKGEELIRQGLALDPQHHLGRICLVRHFLAAGKKEEALELAEEHHALLRVPLLPAAPKVDGDPADDAWQAALRHVDKPWYHSTARYAAKPTDGKNDLYLGHRDGTVYFAVLGHEEDLSKLIVKHKGRDSGCYKDDCVEIFVDTDGSGSGACHLILNPVGALHDAYNRKRSENFMCQWGAKIHKDRGYWSVEVALPAKSLRNAKITADTIWGICVMRMRIGPASEACTIWPTYGSNHRYHLFPIAVFEGLGGTP